MILTSLTLKKITSLGNLNLTILTFMILTSLTLKKITSLGNLNLTSLPLIILTSQNVAPSVDFGFN